MFGASTAEDKVKAALDLIVQYGGVDGSHHKQWLLDQVVRTLVNGEYEYRQFCERIRVDEDGEVYEEWDEGIAP